MEIFLVPMGLSKLEKQNHISRKNFVFHPKILPLDYVSNSPRYQCARTVEGRASQLSCSIISLKAPADSP